MRFGRLAWIVVALGLVAAAPAYAGVQVAVQEGRVTITAKDATVAEILAEWARVADMKIVHADKLPAGRVTIELQNVTERDALDVLLRDVGGYIAHRRSSAAPAPSSIDYILVMAPSAPLPPPPVAMARAGAAPEPSEARVDDASADADDTAPAAAPAVAQRAPTFTTVGTPPEPDDPATTEPMVVPMLTQQEQAEVAVQQTVIRARHALETVNPRNFVLPKKGGR